MGLDGDFVKAFSLIATYFFPMPLELVFSQSLQCAHLAVGAHKRFPAARDFRGDQLTLFLDCLALCLEQQLIALQFHQLIHIHNSGPRRLRRPRA
jgi:hypothetical protein